MPDHSSPACRRKINRHLAGRPGNVCEVAGRMHVGSPSRFGSQLGAGQEGRWPSHWAPGVVTLPPTVLKRTDTSCTRGCPPDLPRACRWLLCVTPCSQPVVAHGPAEMSDACRGFFPGSSSWQDSWPRVRSPHLTLSSGSALGLDPALSGSTSRYRQPVFPGRGEVCIWYRGAGRPMKGRIERGS